MLLNISASRQNIKNLIGNFGAIYVGNMHTKFQPSSTKCVGGRGGVRWRGGGAGSPLVCDFSGIALFK